METVKLVMENSPMKHYQRAQPEEDEDNMVDTKPINHIVSL
jgi:hypothetical protein